MILHAEDNKTVADAVRETLEFEGWLVEVCKEGDAALRKIAGDSQYDVLLLDNDLPGIDGMEIVRVVRQLPHRQQTPIIMLSASDCAREARHAGADAFLRKPEDMPSIVETISRLLS